MQVRIYYRELYFFCSSQENHLYETFFKCSKQGSLPMPYFAHYTCPIFIKISPKGQGCGGVGGGQGLGSGKKKSIQKILVPD